MAADDDRARARSPYEIPADEPPVTKAGDGDWVLEFARPKGDEIEIAVKRVGGIVRIRGMAVVRHAKGLVEQPVTVVMRDEDAGALSMDLIRERRGM